jgi:hypothetical protein
MSNELAVVAHQSQPWSSAPASASSNFSGADPQPAHPEGSRGRHRNQAWQLQFSGNRNYSLLKYGGTLEKPAAMANHTRRLRRSSTIAAATRSASMKLERIVI